MIVKKDTKRPELRRCLLSSLLIGLYKVPLLSYSCIRMALFLEGGEVFSYTIRAIADHYYGIKVDAYSFGIYPLFRRMIRGEMHNITIGRYVSMSSTVTIIRRNHPMERLSMHPFFYEKNFGFVKEHNLKPHNSLFIDHDAWLGSNVIITPSCSRIGIGAVAGSGSVVTKDVPDFAIVTGNPAKIVCFRFSEDICGMIKAKKWWEHSIGEIAPFMEFMSKPFDAKDYDKSFFNW